MPQFTIRLADINDSSDFVKIYGPYVKNTSITFEYEVPSEEEFKNRIQKISSKYPWIVCEIDGKVAGYAYASQFRERIAYTWTVELSIYISQDYQRNRIGTALYRTLIELLRLQGYYTAYAVITHPNEKSEKFHEKLGFKSVGIFHNAGYKLNKWSGIKCYELTIAEYPEKPQLPERIEDIKETTEFEEILKKGTVTLNEE